MGATLQPGEGASYWVLGDRLTFKLASPDLSIVESVTLPGQGPPPHIHGREDEAFYVIEGSFEFLLGDHWSRAEAGAFIHVPRGTLHAFRNAGASRGRMVVTLSPGGFEKFWQEVGTPAGTETEPPPLTEADIARALAAAPRFALQVMPPKG